MQKGSSLKKVSGKSNDNKSPFCVFFKNSIGGRKTVLRILLVLAEDCRDHLAFLLHPVLLIHPSPNSFFSSIGKWEGHKRFKKCMSAIPKTDLEDAPARHPVYRFQLRQLGSSSLPRAVSINHRYISGLSHLHIWVEAKCFSVDFEKPTTVPSSFPTPEMGSWFNYRPSSASK